MSTQYVYKRTEFSPYCLYTVGYYDPDGIWHSESDHDTSEDAAKRTAWLNGGTETKIDKYPDTEADGFVFCGKCGKLKTE